MIYDIDNYDINSYVNAKQRLQQINQNLTEDRYKEKAAATKKANIMYFNHLVRAKRLKYMLTFLVGVVGFFLITIFIAVLIGVYYGDYRQVNQLRYLPM